MKQIIILLLGITLFTAVNASAKAETKENINFDICAVSRTATVTQTGKDCFGNNVTVTVTVERTVEATTCEAASQRAFRDAHRAASMQAVVFLEAVRAECPEVPED